MIGALIYPAFLIGLYESAHVAHGGGDVVGSVFVGLFLAAVFTVPLYGFLWCLRLGRIEARSVGEQRVRALCHLVVATPPLFGAFGVFFTMLRLPSGDYALWTFMWIVIVAYALCRPGNDRLYHPRVLARGRLRFLHGLSAAALIFVFIAMHLGNHVTALWNLRTHSMIMTALRHWYRGPAVERVLVVLMLFQIASGLVLLFAKLDRPSDFYQSVQTATGAYLAIYIAAHMTAIFLLGRWFLGMDTNTSYIFLKDGYLSNFFSVRFVSHYGLGAFAVITHAACGLRNVMIAHHLGESAANRIFSGLAASGAIVGVAITMALCAVRIGPA